MKLNIILGGRWHFDTLCGHHGMLYPRGKNFAESLGSGTYTDKCFYKK